MDPLQDPRLRIHVSASLYLRLLCKIHVSGSVYKHPYVSQDPLQDPCLRIHVSASLYLRLLCEIHVSGSVYKHPYVSQDPLQDPCLRIHASTSLYLRNLCKIHVSGSVYKHPYVSQDPLQDPCLRFMSQHPSHPILWPCAGETQILTSGDAFCVALRRENTPAQIRGSFSRRRNANFDLRRRVLCGPAQGKQSDRVFRAGETQILNCRDAFFVALRRRNANLTSRDASCVHIMRIHEESRPDERKSPRRYSETPKKIPSNRFAQAKRKFWPPESRFLWPCAMKNEQTENLHLDLRAFTPTVRTPQCATLFGEKMRPEGSRDLLLWIVHWSV